MNYYDPARPRAQFSNLPMYTDNGEKIACLPRINLHPNEDGTWTASVMLLIGWNEAKAFDIRVMEDDIDNLLLQWRLDPESVMRSWFRWTGYRTGPRVKAQADTGLSLEDLGL